MQAIYSIEEWEQVVRQDAGRLGVSPMEAGRHLSLSEQAIGELMLKGYLNVSFIVEDGETKHIVIPNRDVELYAETHQGVHPSLLC